MTASDGDTGKTRLRLDALSGREPTAFDITPTPETLAALRDRLGLIALRKVRFAGKIAPDGGRDWRLAAHLGATVVQPCGITLEPVTTRLEEDVERHYLADWQPPQDTEVEMPEDDTAEPVPETLDLHALLEESLALALPPFPRAPGAEIGSVQAAPPGTEPLDDGRENPFGALADLKKKLDP